MFRILEDRITAEIFIMGVIGDEGLRSMEFTQVLHEAEAAGAKQFICRINSPGGEVFEAIAIFNALAERNVSVSIEGLAASSASFIAMAGKSVKMFDNSLVMIHNPWTFAAGDANYFEKIQENLDQIKSIIMKAYSRTGLSDKQLTKMMDEETWLTAQEAKAYKFIDEIVESNQTPQNKSKAKTQYYNQILDGSLFTRKVNQMMKIQTALNMPGADEDKMAQSILALQKTKNELDGKVGELTAELQKKQKVVDDAQKELDDIKVKLEALEKEKKDADELKAQADAEAVLNKAVEDGKIMPAEIDPTSADGKKNREGYLAHIRMNAKMFESLPVVNKIGAPLPKNQASSSPVDVVREAQILVADMNAKGIKMTYTNAVKEVMKKHGIK